MRKNCARRPQSGAPYLRKNVTQQDREICSSRDHWFTKLCFSHAQQATLRARRVNTNVKPDQPDFSPSLKNVTVHLGLSFSYFYRNY